MSSSSGSGKDRVRFCNQPDVKPFDVKPETSKGSSESRGMKDSAGGDQYSKMPEIGSKNSAFLPYRVHKLQIGIS